MRLVREEHAGHLLQCLNCLVAPLYTGVSALHDEFAAPHHPQHALLVEHLLYELVADEQFSDPLSHCLLQPWPQHAGACTVLHADACFPCTHDVCLLKQKAIHIMS